MEVYILNTKITLTKDQVDAIEREKAKRKRSANSYIKILRHFGFKKIRSTASQSVSCFEHKQQNWYAELTIHNSDWHSVWIVGQGLKCTGFPGGWVYESPKEIEAELIRAIEKNLDSPPGQ